MKKPKNLQEIWTEAELCEKLNLPITTRVGRSLQLGNWIRGGLRYVEKSGRRYFFESDVVSYLWQSKKGPRLNKRNTLKKWLERYSKRV